MNQPSLLCNFFIFLLDSILPFFLYSEFRCSRNVDSTVTILCAEFIGERWKRMTAHSTVPYPVPEKVEFLTLRKHRSHSSPLQCWWASTRTGSLAGETQVWPYARITPLHTRLQTSTCSGAQMTILITLLQIRRGKGMTPPCRDHRINAP